MDDELNACIFCFLFVFAFLDRMDDVGRDGDGRCGWMMDDG